MITTQEKVLDALHTHATYQRAVALGDQALSGADLRGRAREYGGNYARARQHVADLWRANGGHVRVGPHGRITLEEGDPPAGAVGTGTSVGTGWRY